MVRCLFCRSYVRGACMTGLSHMITGVVAAKFLPLPLVLPVAFTSHFLVDAILYFDEMLEKRRKLVRTVWVINFVLLACFLVFLIVRREWVFLLSGVVAMSPDFAWVYRFAVQERFGKRPPRPVDKFNVWHAHIQQYKTRLDIVIKVLWPGLMLKLLRMQ